MKLLSVSVASISILSIVAGCTYKTEVDVTCVTIGDTPPTVSTECQTPPNGTVFRPDDIKGGE